MRTIGSGVASGGSGSFHTLAFWRFWMCCTVPDLNGGLDVLQVAEVPRFQDFRGESFRGSRKNRDVFGAYGVIGGSGGCEGSGGDGSGDMALEVMVSRLSHGCRGVRRLRFQFRGSFRRFRGGLGQA